MENDQSKTTLQKQAKRRRNRTKSNVAKPDVAQPKPHEEQNCVAVKSDAPIAKQNTSVVTEAPKRHRIRVRKRNKSQLVNKEELPPQEPMVIPTSTVALALQEQIEAVIHREVNSVPHNQPEMKSSAVGSGGSPHAKPSKEQVLADREAKRLAKQAAKHKIVDNARDIGATSPVTEKTEPIVEKVVEVAAKVVEAQPAAANVEAKSEKSREEVMAEREAKKLAKLAAKSKGKTTPAEVVDKPVDKKPESVPKVASENEIAAKVQQLNITEKPVLSKAERRAKQEAQRAAKAALTTPASDKKAPAKPSETAKIQVPTAPPKKSSPSTQAASVVSKTPSLHRVKLFNHLYTDRQPPPNAINSTTIHPSVVKLGAQYANRIVVGANARCIAFMNTMKEVIVDYETPTKKEFARGLESVIKPCLDFLQQCRPLSVSIMNAVKFIKMQITHLPSDESEAEQKERLVESIETYIRDQVEKAAQAISISVQQKISNGDVILTFGCSSLISHILEEAQKRRVDFRVVVVDARPDHEGQEMLRRLVAQGIRCTCVLINAVAFIMPEVTKVLLGANALMANGYVMSRAGTAQVAMLAKAHNVPVLVCCETHKFSERVQTDAFVYNEIGDPNALVLKTKNAKEAGSLANWETLPHLTPLNLSYDITPPELVTAVVTELAILPCTSVPVILRIQPSS